MNILNKTESGMFAPCMISLLLKDFLFPKFIHLEGRHLLDVETSHDNDGFRNCVTSGGLQYPSPKQMI